MSTNIFRILFSKMNKKAFARVLFLFTVQSIDVTCDLVEWTLYFPLKPWHAQQRITL